MTHNQLLYWQNVETKRANQARELENNRANLARESNDRLNRLESARHNVASEKETKRSNLASEGIQSDRNVETRRHNLVTEQRDLLGLTTQRDVLSESIRHNRAAEKNDLYRTQTRAQTAANQLAETTRHNKWDEGIRIGSKAADTVVNLLGVGARTGAFNSKGGSSNNGKINLQQVRKDYYRQKRNAR